MKKRILIVILWLIPICIYSKNAMVIRKINYDEITRDLYIEAVYQLEEDLYVPQALCESYGMCTIVDKKLFIRFFPRGNKISKGDYSALRGNLVKKISTGDILVFRCHLENVLYLQSRLRKEFQSLTLRDFDSIEFIFVEVCFEDCEYIVDDYLLPTWSGNLVWIYSESINLIKEGSYFKITDETLQRLFPNEWYFLPPPLDGKTNINAVKYTMHIIQSLGFSIPEFVVLPWIDKGSEFHDGELKSVEEQGWIKK